MFYSSSMGLHFILLITNAFKLVSTTNAWVVTPQACRNDLTVARGSVDADDNGKSNNIFESKTLSRRDALSTVLSSSFAAIGGVVSATTGPTVQMANADAASAIRVDVWPSLEYLEPLYEFSLSVKALKDGISVESSTPYIKKRLDKFFEGGLFSERNFYAGLNVRYMNEIKYSASELPGFIKIDKEQRFDTMENCLVNIEKLYKELKKGTKDASAVNMNLAQIYANDAYIGIQSWLSLVPQDQVRFVDDLYTHVRQADVNRNGKMEPTELMTLTPEEQKVWKKRIDLVGG